MSFFDSTDADHLALLSDAARCSVDRDTLIAKAERDIIARYERKTGTATWSVYLSGYTDAEAKLSQAIVDTVAEVVNYRVALNQESQEIGSVRRERLGDHEIEYATALRGVRDDVRQMPKNIFSRLDRFSTLPANWFN